MKIATHNIEFLFEEGTHTPIQEKNGIIQKSLSKLG